MTRPVLSIPSVGATIAVVVLVLAILLAVLGRMEPLLAGLFAALALSRLL